MCLTANHDRSATPARFRFPFRASGVGIICMCIRKVKAAVVCRSIGKDRGGGAVCLFVCLSLERRDFTWRRRYARGGLNV